ncbi:MAG: hypothetical protein LBU58_03385 [Clostridiales bacterium]|jgi:formylmethanofuran dehydrogenase subunit B|nr:hypothetical protein [Clostridiales bacterium]
MPDFDLLADIDPRLTPAAVDQILEEIEKTLREMRRLAVFAAEASLTEAQRARVQQRFDALKAEIDGIASMLRPPQNLP